MSCDNKEVVKVEACSDFDFFVLCRKKHQEVTGTDRSPGFLLRSIGCVILFLCKFAAVFPIYSLEELNEVLTFISLCSVRKRIKKLQGPTDHQVLFCVRSAK